MMTEAFWQMEYVDSIMIIDKNYTIIHLSRFNPRFEEDAFIDAYSEYVNKNFFEVYPGFSNKDSSVVECMRTGKVAKRENQIFRDYKGRIYNTTNVNIPIVKKGEVVGVIELSKDVTSIHDLDDKLKMEEVQKMRINIEKEHITFEDILTSNEHMIENVRKAKIFSQSDRPTLVYGETGTGKELYVSAMYHHSQNHIKTLIAQNCAALPESLFESILFGAVKGAFTGAETKIGLFEQADGGTLFLDELNSMPYGIQAKLLRVLQDGKIRPIGSDKEKRINVKVIAAMNIDPMEAIKKNLLREDLFYRFSSSTIRLVPLRERREDILLYANYFLKSFNEQYSKNIKGFTSNLVNVFMDYAWNGNVRELKHIIEAMVSINDDGFMDSVHLPAYMQNRIVEPVSKDKQDDDMRSDLPFMPLNETLLRTEKELIARALNHTRGNLTRAGQILGIPRQTLKYKINKLNIQLEQFKWRKAVT